MAAIWPLLSRPDPGGDGLRTAIFNNLHEPGKATWGAGDRMPKALGDDPYWGVAGSGWGKQARSRLTITPTQYALLEQWSKRNFIAGSAAPPGPVGLTGPHDLDRHALEACVGGAFFPGIECGWQIRHPALYGEPFRIKHGASTQFVSDTGAIGPGHFSRQMALPWQADFLQCTQETDSGGVDWAWWPAQRPDFVYLAEGDAKARSAMSEWVRATAGGAPASWPVGGKPRYDEFLANWWKFGFVVERNDVQFEMERAADIP
jgi:hypothetical protein